MTKDKLQIYLVTYNRKEYLKRTLDSILAYNSPIKDFDISILDNCSTDGTNELLEEYCKKYPNLVHIRHCINIGGNANITRAFEFAASCKKEYFWVLCDDDKFDFSNWSEVEQNIEKQKDIICVCNYSIKYPIDTDNNYIQKLFQLTFLPAGIYRTDIMTEYIIGNMYISIYAMFPHLCPVINVVNRKQEIALISKPIVFNGLHCENACKSISYQRGMRCNEIVERYKETSWILGFASLVTLLKDKQLQNNCIKYAIVSDEIYGNFENFYWSMYNKYLSVGRINYIYEIFKYLPVKHMLKFLLKSFCWTIQNKKLRNKILAKKKKKIVQDKQYWEDYFKKTNLQEKLNRIAFKNKNKKILLYGNGIISEIVQNQYDLSKLNIVGITDRKFLGCDCNYNGEYNVIPPNKLKALDFDCVLVCMKQSENLKKTMNDNGLRQKIIKII